jgi:cytochrome c-type biogenesis protein CcmH/NrfG
MTTTNTRAQLNKASALIKNNQKPRAIALLKPILAQDPNNAEAWWLAAHASPTPDAAIEACRRLLALKPDSEPARRMIVEQQLKKAADLLKEAEVARVQDMVRPILAEQLDHVEALWLYARAAPTSAEAIALGVRFLAV